jgi:hypothetical protein
MARPLELLVPPPVIQVAAHLADDGLVVKSICGGEAGAVMVMMMMMTPEIR